jgi:hypothetical protein
MKNRTPTLSASPVPNQAFLLLSCLPKTKEKKGRKPTPENKPEIPNP